MGQVCLDEGGSTMPWCHLWKSPDVHSNKNSSPVRLREGKKKKNTPPAALVNISASTTAAAVQVDAGVAGIHPRPFRVGVFSLPSVMVGPERSRDLHTLAVET